jgi:hypothetical protein
VRILVGGRLSRARAFRIYRIERGDFFHLCFPSGPEERDFMDLHHNRSQKSKLLTISPIPAGFKLPRTAFLCLQQRAATNVSDATILD